MSGAGTIFVEEDMWPRQDDEFYLPGEIIFRNDGIYLRYQGRSITLQELVEMANEGGFKKHSEWNQSIYDQAKKSAMGGLFKQISQYPLRLAEQGLSITPEEADFINAKARIRTKKLISDGLLGLYEGQLYGSILSTMPIKIQGLSLSDWYSIKGELDKLGKKFTDQGGIADPGYQERSQCQTIDDLPSILRDMKWGNIEKRGDSFYAEFEVFNDPL